MDESTFGTETGAGVLFYIVACLAISSIVQKKKGGYTDGVF